MVNQITQDYIKLGNARSGNDLTTVRGIVSHDTGNAGSTAHQNRNYFNNQQPSASAHTFIDDQCILEIVPLNEKAFHVRYDMDRKLCGYYANDYLIGVELCWGGEIDFHKAYEKYVWYHAYLCKKFNLNPQRQIYSHKQLDPKRKTDPDNALNRYGIKWEQFLKDVYEEFINWGKSVSERKLSGMKPNWKDWQWKEAAEIYERAHDKGMLSSLDWSEKAKKKELTFDDIEYLNLVINGRKL